MIPMGMMLHVVAHMEGHVRPNLAIAEALVERGHEVAVAAPPQVASLLESSSCQSMPLWGLSNQARDFQVFAGEGRIRDVGKWLVESHFTPRRLLAELEDVARVVDRWRPDVLIFDQWSGGSQFVLPDWTGLPSVLFSMALFPFGHGRGAPSDAVRNGREGQRLRANAECGLWRGALRTGEVAQLLHAAGARERYGLEAVGGDLELVHSRFDRILLSSIPGFDPCVLPENGDAVGPSILHGLQQGSDLQAMGLDAGDVPLICASLSSVHFHRVSAERQLETLLKALAGLPVRAVVSTAGQPLDDRPTPPNVRLERWVSWNELLPHARLSINNGGAGAVGLALAAGVPQIVLPLHSDQPENAWRVQDREVGLRLPPDVSVTRLKASIDSVLAAPVYCESCRRLSVQIGELGGASRAAEIIEGLG